MQSAIPHPPVQYAGGYNVRTLEKLQNRGTSAYVTVPLKPSYSARFMSRASQPTSGLSNTPWQITNNFQQVPVTPGQGRLIDQLNTVICVPTPRCDRSRLKDGWKRVTYIACAKFAQKYTVPRLASRFTKVTTFEKVLKRFILKRRKHWCPGTLINDR